jgi:hypothetical protein
MISVFFNRVMAVNPGAGSCIVLRDGWKGGCLTRWTDVSM